MQVICIAEVGVYSQGKNLEELFLFMISAFYFTSTHLVVDLWIMPFVMFISHTYLFCRLYFSLENLSENFFISLYFPILCFYLFCKEITKQNGKEYMFSHIQKFLTQELFQLLKIFPERIVV